LLNTIAACGDVNRNVMSNPNPYQSKAHAVALELARGILDHLTPRTGAYREIWLDGEKIAGGEPEVVEPIYGKTYLPRKVQDRGGGCRPRTTSTSSRTISGSSRSSMTPPTSTGWNVTARRRHGHDPWRARHLSARRRRDGLLPDA
jgi:hypothetical protein